MTLKTATGAGYLHITLKYDKRISHIWRERDGDGVLPTRRFHQNRIGRYIPAKVEKYIFFLLRIITNITYFIQGTHNL